MSEKSGLQLLLCPLCNRGISSPRSLEVQPIRLVWAHKMAGAGAAISVLNAQHNKALDTRQTASDANTDRDLMSDQPQCGWDVAIVAQGQLESVDLCRQAAQHQDT